MLSNTTFCAFRKGELTAQSFINLLRVSVGLFLVLILSACDSEPRRTDAELGLTPRQAAGRRVYDVRCAECHYAYSARNLRGPSMHGLYQKKFMTSGMPVNDDRVMEIILLGRAKMPGFQQKLTAQQLQDLIAYLHTL